MNKTNCKVAIMAGGTGGHIFPGLAVAKELIKQNVEVVWLGAKGGMEEKLVQKHGIPIHLLAIKGLRGKGLKGMISMPFKLFSATKVAGKILKQEKIDAVISMGGYVAGPGGLAARFKRIPVLVHEQNSKFGMTNKYLSKWAQRVLTGFNLDKLYNSQWVGNPVREEIENCIKHENTSNKVNVLIVGGSLGANSLNSELPELLLPYMQNNMISVIHQCGKNNLSKTQEHYQITTENIVNNIQIREFISNMCAVYAWADFIIARAGALTIAEINAVGLPSILVPYPYAVDDHQTSNAKNIVHNMAGYLWQESDEKEKLVMHIKDLVGNKVLLEEMAKNSKKLHNKSSALKVANICLEMIR